MKDKIYLALLHSLWISHNKLHKIFTKNLLSENTNYELFYNKLNNNLLQEYWFKNKEIEDILSRKNKITFNFIKSKLEEREVKIITIEDDDYPKELKNIFNVPYLIYVRWNILSWPKIAVVGSRNITSYWKKTIEKIVPEISRYFIIVSGWAYWCDTFAHNESMNSWNKTISVIWTSISEDYPVWNKKMYDEIIDTWWAIISIFPIWVPWNSYNFPIRNEIVAWLST